MLDTEKNPIQDKQDTIETLEDTDETLTPQPMPPWIKFGVPALIAAVVIGIVVLRLTTGAGKTTTTNLDDVEIGTGASSVPTLTKNKTTSSDAPEKTKSLPFDKSDEKELGEMSDLGLRLPLVYDKETAKKLEQLQNDLVAVKNNYQHEQDNAIKDLQTKLTTQQAWTEELQTKLMAQQAQIEKLLGRLKPSDTKPVKRYKPQPSVAVRPATVPFALVSVDQWGDERYAVFRQDGQLTELTQGQVIDQWNIEAIDSRSVTIRNPRGEIKELSIQ